jgi:hypothetical protein
MKNKKIFSGNESKDFWDAINNAKSIADLKIAMYITGCKLQELEDKISENKIDKGVE